MRWRICWSASAMLPRSALSAKSISLAKTVLTLVLAQRRARVKSLLLVLVWRYTPVSGGVKGIRQEERGEDSKECRGYDTALIGKGSGINPSKYTVHVMMISNITSSSHNYQQNNSTLTLTNDTMFNPVFFVVIVIIIIIIITIIILLLLLSLLLLIIPFSVLHL